MRSEFLFLLSSAGLKPCEDTEPHWSGSKGTRGGFRRDEMFSHSWKGTHLGLWSNGFFHLLRRGCWPSKCTDRHPPPSKHLFNQTEWLALLVLFQLISVFPLFLSQWLTQSYFIDTKPIKVNLACFSPWQQSKICHILGDVIAFKNICICHKCFFSYHKDERVFTLFNFAKSVEALRLLHFYYTSYLNFADPDKVSILLNNVSSFQWVSVFEPGEGGRWDPGCRAFQLQRTVHSDEELLWRAGAGHLWRLWRRDHQNILALLFIYLKNCPENTDCCVITKHGEIEGFCAASSLITGHTAVQASIWGRNIWQLEPCLLSI